ncbi:MAG: aldehyde dehydrogenase [Rhodoglobus sp.]|nr:aldehyde dehydrogenase [Rhodoglobus sp.]
MTTTKSMIDLHAPAEKIFVAGRWESGVTGALMNVESPVDESVLARVPSASAADLDRAYTGAAAAAEAWGSISWVQRAKLMRELAERVRESAERLAVIEALDSGNPIAACRDDVEAAAEGLNHMAGLAGEAGGRTIPSRSGTLVYTRRRPFGVVGRITAYNHPLRFAGKAIAAPLAAGNAVILKPADQTPLTSLELARLSEGILPPGVLSVLSGTGAGVGSAIAGDPRIRRIGFTGSVEAGRAVLSAGARGIKSVSLELGGKNPIIICDDVDLEAAALATVRGMNLTSSNGQSCQSNSRVLVQDSIHEEFIDILVEHISRLRVGDPLDPEKNVGTLISAPHLERVMGYIRRAVEEGAVLRHGGGRPAGQERGYFIEPAVLSDVAPGSTLAKEEVFGPVLAIMRWRNDDEAIQIANDTEFGLAANVLTASFDRAHRIADRLEAGVVWINGPTERPPGTPFGGLKNSGLGKEQSLEELLSYTQETAVLAAY